MTGVTADLAKLRAVVGEGLQVPDARAPFKIEANGVVVIDPSYVDPVSAGVVYDGTISSLDCDLRSAGFGFYDDQTLKDSGERRDSGTGAVRDRATGKGRFDLLPLYGILSAAMQMERGAAKYSERNWEKGMPLSWFLDSANRHLLKLMAGFDDEPHLDALIWNVLCLREGQERIKRGLWPAEMDDLPKTYAGQPYPLDFNDFAGTGTGVGCSLGYVVQFQATLTGSTYTVTKTPLNLNTDGSKAAAGTTSTVVDGAPANDSRVRVAKEISCEAVTVDNGGVAVG